MSINRSEHPRPHRRHAPAPLPMLLALTALLMVGLPSPQVVAEGPDPRLVVDSSDRPRWARAIGRLRIPVERREAGRIRHYTESCSATLLAPGADRRGMLVLTAWHCLDGYEDLSRPVRLELPLADGGPWVGEVRVERSGGGMHADWALLRLHEPPPAGVEAAKLATRRSRESDRLIMAGHSRDGGLGEGGRALTYDARCRITGRHGQDWLTNCKALPGASGGAVFINEGRSWHFAGVISRGDRARRSVFVPLWRFMDRIDGPLSRGD